MQENTKIMVDEEIEYMEIQLNIQEQLLVDEMRILLSKPIIEASIGMVIAGMILKGLK